MSTSLFIYNEIKFHIRKLRIDLNHLLYESPERDHRIISGSQDVSYRSYGHFNVKTGYGGILMSLRTNYRDYNRNRSNSDVTFEQPSQFLSQLETIEEGEDDYDANASILDNYNYGNTPTEIKDDHKEVLAPETLHRDQQSITEPNENAGSELYDDKQGTNSQVDRIKSEIAEEEDMNGHTSQPKHPKSFRLEKLFNQFIEKRRLLKQEFKQKFSSKANETKPEDKQSTTNEENKGQEEDGNVLLQDNISQHTEDINNIDNEAQKSDSIGCRFEDYKIDIINSANLELTKSKNTSQGDGSSLVSSGVTTATTGSWTNVFNDVSKNAALVSTGHPPYALSKKRITSDFTSLNNYNHHSNPEKGYRLSSSSYKPAKDRITKQVTFTEKENEGDIMSTANDGVKFKGTDSNVNGEVEESIYSNMSDFVIANYKAYEQTIKDNEDKEDDSRISNKCRKIDVVRVESEPSLQDGHLLPEAIYKMMEHRD